MADKNNGFWIIPPSHLELRTLSAYCENRRKLLRKLLEGSLRESFYHLVEMILTIPIIKCFHLILSFRLLEIIDLVF